MSQDDGAAPRPDEREARERRGRTKAGVGGRGQTRRMDEADEGVTERGGTVNQTRQLMAGCLLLSG